MSRFFNQTRRADQHVNVTPVSDAPVTESLNVQEILGTIPDDESDTAIAAPGNGGHLFPVESSLADLGAEITAAPAVVEVKPERYRTFSLPRTLERLFVSESPDSDHLAVESYRTLRTRLLREQAKRGFRSMIISSCSPEEGKTLTAANLAVSFGQLTKFPVLLVDGDLRTRGLSRLLGDPSGPGLAELLAGQVTR